SPHPGPLPAGEGNLAMHRGTCTGSLLRKREPWDAPRYLYGFPPTEEGTLGCTAVLVRVPSCGRGNLAMHRGTRTGSHLRERESCDAPRYLFGSLALREREACDARWYRYGFPLPQGEGQGEGMPTSTLEPSTTAGDSRDPECRTRAAHRSARPRR